MMGTSMQRNVARNLITKFLLDRSFYFPSLDSSAFYEKQHKTSECCVTKN